jgi:hypothetical protein
MLFRLSAAFHRLSNERLSFSAVVYAFRGLLVISQPGIGNSDIIPGDCLTGPIRQVPLQRQLVPVAFERTLVLTPVVVCYTHIAGDLGQLMPVLQVTKYFRSLIENLQRLALLSRPRIGDGEIIQDLTLACAVTCGSHQE